MAINTDASIGKDAFADTGASHPAEFKDTHKLLAVSTTEQTDGYSPRRLESPRGSVKSLNADQNGHRLPFKTASTVNLATSPRSPSRLSFSRQESPTPSGPVPPSFLWLAILSCFCPSVPLNLLALYFAHLSRTMVEAGDLQGAKRLGRMALLLSIFAILMGIAILLYLGISGS